MREEQARLRQEQFCQQLIENHPAARVSTLRTLKEEGRERDESHPDG